MSGEDRNGSDDGWGRSPGTGDGQGPGPAGFTDPAAQQRHWESLSSQYPSNDGSVPPPVSGPELPPQAAGAASREPQRRFSTPAVAALVLAVGVAASAVTAGVINQTGDDSTPVTSLNQSSSSDRGNTPVSAPDPGTVESVAQNVLPSVVSIQVATREGGAEGSGSIISQDGLILTNNHVVAGAEGGNAQMSVTTNDGRQLEAEVVATDPQTDLAVVKASGADDLQPIAIGDSDGLRVGETVIAVGSPLGLSSTVTTGIVSAMNRPVQAGGEGGGEASLIDAIQTDAAINPGNSGGALVNLRGELVGIPSVIATLGGQMGGESGSIGLGFAIPSNQAEDTAQQLIDNGRATHPVIGARVNTGAESRVRGAEIVSVSDGGPAADAGIRDGDVVTKVGDRIVDSGVSLIAAIRSHNVGDEVTLTVTDGNGGNEREVGVTLSESDAG
ncbi:trypsin-like peptidase domain-containing protein [Corynebacterium kalidii]|uniref:Trypsin-like peptidase domain-containing protein n=1 Tax=Corynebacterium kalidii TaxID=2931982 RepID=A0A9X2B1J0_9CORY|nr:trypsin-like peptidase domain-containing protein [Corynebacterium kalidii]MCJ7858089.1 trypsin-like peptidase domain-containing protein [Corynebacterium kalidii]